MVLQRTWDHLVLHSFTTLKEIKDGRSSDYDLLFSTRTVFTLTRQTNKETTTLFPHKASVADFAKESKKLRLTNN